MSIETSFVPPVLLSNQEIVWKLDYIARFSLKCHEIPPKTTSPAHNLVIEYSIDMPTYFSIRHRENSSHLHKLAPGKCSQTLLITLAVTRVWKLIFLSCWISYIITSKFLALITLSDDGELSCSVQRIGKLFTEVFPLWKTLAELCSELTSTTMYVALERNLT